MSEFTVTEFPKLNCAVPDRGRHTWWLPRIRLTRGPGGFAVTVSVMLRNVHPRVRAVVITGPRRTVVDV